MICGEWLEAVGEGDEQTVGMAERAVTVKALSFIDHVVAAIVYVVIRSAPADGNHSELVVERQACAHPPEEPFAAVVVDGNVVGNRFAELARCNTFCNVDFVICRH